METKTSDERLAGVAALAAGIAWVTWAVLNARSHGGLDVGVPAVTERLARAGQLLMAAWNVLLIPAALALQQRADGRTERARLATVCGIASLLFWAFGGATHRITPALEVTYLALSGVWWCGIGAAMRPSTRWFGALTFVLGLFALWDAALTALEPVPFSLYLTASPKLPLSILWDFALAYILLRPARRLATPQSVASAF